MQAFLWHFVALKASMLRAALRTGDTQFAGVQHGSWMQAWRQFGWLPELFDIGITTRHPLEKVDANDTLCFCKDDDRDGPRCKRGLCTAAIAIERQMDMRIRT